MAESNAIQPGRLENLSVGRSIKPVTSVEVRLNTANDADGDSSQRVSHDVQPDTGVTSTSEVVDKIDQLTEKLNVQLEKSDNYLRFEKDEDSERMVIFIKNSETDEVIRQIPSQEFLAISKNITQFLEMRQQPSEGAVAPLGLITDETA